ncbi:hypothetical protein MMPV_009545 [Pyropia vietnamensis]
MANRANRSLLFGPAGTNAGGVSGGGGGGGDGGVPSAAAAANAEALIADNDRSIDALQGRSGAIKAMALQIDDDVTSQNAFLDTAVAGRMDSTAGALGGALNQLRLLTDDSRGGCRKSTLLVAGGVGAMTVLYLLLRMLF